MLHIPAHVKSVALQEWLLNFKACLTSMPSSSSSWIQHVDSHVVMRCLPKVCVLSFQDGRKGFESPKCSLASMKDDPHGLASKKRPRQTKGSSRVLASLLIDVLCFSVSASIRTMLAKTFFHMSSICIAWDHLAQAKTQKRIEPAMTPLCMLSECKQMSSKILIASTEKAGAWTNFLFERNIVWAAPVTLDDITCLMSTCTMPSTSWHIRKACSKWEAAVAPAPECLKYCM